VTNNLSIAIWQLSWLCF